MVEGVTWLQEGRVLASPVSYRMRAGVLEVGLPAEKEPDLKWGPFFKVNAQTGDTWSGPAADGITRYQLVEFTENRGRPAAIILKKSQSKNSLPGVETVSVFVKDIGEVERRTYDVTPMTNVKRLTAEMHLVEDGSIPVLKSAGKDKKK